MIRNGEARLAGRLGLALDDDPLFAELIDAVRATAGRMGATVIEVRSPADEATADVLLLIGRPGRHRGLLEATPPGPRIMWGGEPLSVGGAPLPAAALAADPGDSAGASSRPKASAGRRRRWAGRLPLPAPLARRRADAFAERLVAANHRELAWAVARGAELVVTSHDRAAVLASLGRAARVVPFGYDVALAGAITPPDAPGRDIPLAVLGDRASSWRRASWLDGPGRADGPDAPDAPRFLAGLWGEDRHAVLRRTRVLLDVHRIPGTFVGIRLVLALAAGVAVVTEPMLDARPFAPGATHLEVPTADLLATGRALARDEARRADLVRAGQALLTGELTLAASLAALLSPYGLVAGTSAPRRSPAPAHPA